MKQKCSHKGCKILYKYKMSIIIWSAFSRNINSTDSAILRSPHTAQVLCVLVKYSCASQTLMYTITGGWQWDADSDSTDLGWIQVLVFATLSSKEIKEEPYFLVCYVGICHEAKYLIAVPSNMKISWKEGLGHSPVLHHTGNEASPFLLTLNENIRCQSWKRVRPTTTLHCLAHRNVPVYVVKGTSQACSVFLTVFLFKSNLSDLQLNISKISS